MLAEWYTYLTTPCGPHAKRLGYLRQAVSLASRAKRCRAAWAGHIEHCRALVRTAMRGCAQNRRVVVLGSGLADEIPLSEMAAQFDDVVLIDVVHLPGTRRKVRGFSNVRLIDEDISGVLPAVAKGHPLPAPATSMPAVTEDADLVLSIGLLSQLALLPIDVAGRSDGENTAFGAAMVRAHLDGLASLSGTVCLISDVERQICHGGHVRDREDALFGVALPELSPAQSWLWDIAPAPEIRPNGDVRFVVRGGVL